MYNHTLAITCLIIYPLKQKDVSEFVCLFVCLSAISFETTDPNELIFLWMIFLGVQIVLTYKDSG